MLNWNSYSRSSVTNVVKLLSISALEIAFKGTLCKNLVQIHTLYKLGEAYQQSSLLALLALSLEVQAGSINALVKQD